jgi:hypothetical protein
MATKPRTRRQYRPEEIERGLSALVIAGSSLEASQVTGIPSSTLRAWKLEHADQYTRLQEDLEPKVVKKIAAEAEGIVLRIAGIQHGLLDKFEETMHELKPAEIAGASRNLTTSSALYVDKHSSPLRERPSHVQQLQGLDTLIKRMEREMGFDASSTAVEITDAKALDA